MSYFGINVFDFGAKGDGIHDDTSAIQRAIDHAAERGGGKILFPYTPHGYRIASPGRETYNGRVVRAQLILPPGSANIQLEGEMPCRVLHSYQVRPLEAALHGYAPTTFGRPPINNTCIFSDWDAPEIHDPAEHPWSILAAPEGDSCRGKFSRSLISLTNLEFRVPMDRERMYPTQSAVNLQHCSRVNIRNCHFCLDEQVGDTMLGKELQKNPCHTVGLMTSGDQNDNQVLSNVAVQGFKYGIVMGEHVVADYLYIHNCEEGVVFHDCSHLTVINHIVAQHNAVIIATTHEELFGHRKGPCHVEIGSVNFEPGTDLKPEVSRLRYAVYDPENRLHGSVHWHKPWGVQEFPVYGAEDFSVSRLRSNRIIRV